MRSDNESYRHPLLALMVLRILRAEVTWRDHVDARFVRTAQHHPAIANIPPSAIDAARNVDTCRDVGTTVVCMLQVNWQFGEIGICPGPDDLMDGRDGAWYFK